MTPTRRVKARFVVLVLLSLAGSTLYAAAAPAGAPLRDYIHTSWTQSEGMPLGQVERVAQTSDGYLWIVTRAGFLRFDGMRFVRATTPCTQRVGDIARALDGGLWAVCRGKLIRRTAAGQFVEIPNALSEDTPSPGLLVDRDGRVWLLDKRIRYLGPDGTGGRSFQSPVTSGYFLAAQDSEGTIWASGGGSLYHLYPDRIERVSGPAAYCFTPARDGGVFASTGDRIWRLRKGAPPEPVLDFPVSTLQRCMREAEDGGLWIAARPAGVALFRNGRVETLGDAMQMDRRVMDVLVDREGAVWLAAVGALHRLRPPTVQYIRLDARHDLPMFVFVDSRDRLWVGTGTGLSYRSLNDEAARPVTLAQDYKAIGEDERGTIWLSDENQIGYIANGAFVAVADAAGKPVTHVDAFTRDQQGHLWALAERIGVYRVTPGPPRLVAASPHAAVRFLVSERSGIWIGLDGGGVEQHTGGRINSFPRPNPTLPEVSPRTLVEDGDSIWVGSFVGLERLRNGTWTRWTRDQGLPGDGRVKAITTDRSGHFWMMTNAGLLRLSRPQLDATPDGRPGPLSFAHIGALDGVVPHPGNLRASPAVTSDSNGHLYFTTQDSIAVVDPAAVRESSMTPPIVLESVIVDNEPIDRAAAARFVEPSRLQFEYTSLSLRSPELARFRYRLEGYDADWIEAGAQRQVTYGTLRPGAYLFRVIGAGGEGVWNETGASFAFHVVPVFWRTWWFKLAMTALTVSIATALYRLRIRHLTRQFNLGLEARVGERTRIARELHDTLLQTFQGVLIHFQAATNMLPGRPDEAKRRFEGILEQAGQAVTEGRDAVQALRTSARVSDDLPHDLSVLAEQLTAGAGSDQAPRIHVNVEGTPRSLHPIVRDDVFRIASEALRNAVRHARAASIQADMHYDDRRLALRIRDDGIGFDAAVLEERRVAGHWGLPGMRERAELIGGRLDVRSRPGSGTEIELSLPAAKAYAKTKTRA